MSAQDPAFTAYEIRNPGAQRLCELPLFLSWQGAVDNKSHCLHLAGPQGCARQTEGGRYGDL